MSVSPIKGVSDIDLHLGFKSISICEIEEEIADETNDDCYRNRKPLPTIREEDSEETDGATSHGGDDVVYVGVGKGESSMDALSWALKNAVDPSSTRVFLIHVFPETHYIPYPLGRLHKSQAHPDQLESYMAQESQKRREFLQKFIDACSASMGKSKQVKVEPIMIESDTVATAIQDLIPILNIRKLVLGISKSGARKLKAKRGNGIVKQILNSPAIETCDVKVICEGKEVNLEQMIRSPSVLSSDSGDDYSKSPKEKHHNSATPRKKDQSLDPLACFFDKPETED